MVTAVNPNDQRLHYPDRFKNIGHPRFSAESQWAGRDAPTWINQNQAALPSGRIIYDNTKNPM